VAPYKCSNDTLGATVILLFQKDITMTEILYLPHFGKSLITPFFNRINNNFVYLAHDDGWFCKLYCNDIL
jgi:hypothetical protein